MPRKPMSEETKKKISEAHKANKAFAETHIINKETKEVTPIIQQKVVEVIKEIIIEKIIEVEKPRLEGYELYAKLRDIGYPQGGMGNIMENPNGVDKVYVPHANEVMSFFVGDPDKWEAMRDGVIRTYIEINGNEQY